MEISFFVQSIRRMAFTSAKHGGCLVGSFDGCLCCVDSFQVGSLHETGAKVRFFKTKNGGQGVIQMPAIFFFFEGGVMKTWCLILRDYLLLGFGKYNDLLVGEFVGWHQWHLPFEAEKKTYFLIASTKENQCFFWWKQFLGWVLIFSWTKVLCFISVFTLAENMMYPTSLD